MAYDALNEPLQVELPKSSPAEKSVGELLTLLVAIGKAQLHVLTQIASPQGREDVDELIAMFIDRD